MFDCFYQFALAVGKHFTRHKPTDWLFPAQNSAFDKKKKPAWIYFLAQNASYTMYRYNDVSNVSFSMHNNFCPIKISSAIIMIQVLSKFVSVSTFFRINPHFRYIHPIPEKVFANVSLTRTANIVLLCFLSLWHYWSKILSIVFCIWLWKYSNPVSAS